MWAGSEAMRHHCGRGRGGAVGRSGKGGKRGDVGMWGGHPPAPAARSLPPLRHTHTRMHRQRPEVSLGAEHCRLVPRPRVCRARSPRPPPSSHLGRLLGRPRLGHDGGHVAHEVGHGVRKRKGRAVLFFFCVCFFFIHHEKQKAKKKAARVPSSKQRWWHARATRQWGGGGGAVSAAAPPPSPNGARTRVEPRMGPG